MKLIFIFGVRIILVGVFFFQRYNKWTLHFHPHTIFTVMTTNLSFLKIK
jgi:hypothetical protein